MVAEPAISVKDVTKRYKVRHEKGRTLKEAFLRQKIYSETINALDNVSFEVPRGTTLGLIGSNGSGKSTMLKMIAGTSRPNAGEVQVNGRVSALLELGAGFHPDFTGRENIYLDGAIMGLSRRDVDERLDDIVRFAEMEEFIDAPAKTYSSGMYMRLAFSVAVSVDPDILLIDEVLAVGDESFQRKCLERINEFKGEGKTILFVSHSRDAVRSLCEEAVWLDKGKLRAAGTTDMVIDRYMQSINENVEERMSQEEDKSEEGDRWGTGRALISDVKLLDENGKEKHAYQTGDYMKVRVDYLARERVETPVVGLAIRRSDDVICFGTNTLLLGKPPDVLTGDGTVEFEIENLSLLPASYTFTAAMHNEDGSETYDYRERRFPFVVMGGSKNEVGVSHMDFRWIDWPRTG